VESKSKRLDIDAAPTYYYLEITGGVDIDLVASKAKVDRVCDQCLLHYANGRQWNRTAVPREDTWDGCDLVEVRNYPVAGEFCTERVLLLAREHRWTNFRFLPMDVIMRHTFGWKGIDYRGRKWPPKEWYPPRPSRDHTLEEWIERFKEHPEYRGRPFDALLDFEDQTLPHMLKFLHGDSAPHRRNAAFVLYCLNHDCGIELPEGAEAIMAQELPDLYKYKPERTAAESPSSPAPPDRRAAGK
jgi:hypothetical protein